MNSIERANIMANAEDYWSEEEHDGQMIEECAELIVALRHLDRKRGGMRAVVEEMVDIEIMLERYKSILWDRYEISWEIIKDMKLAKMRDLMARGGK